MRSMWSSLRALVTGLGLAALSSNAHAALAIEPAFIEADLARGNVTKSITVTNRGDLAGQYRAQVYHFAFTTNGGIAKVDPDEHSLATWIKLNPKEFTLGPQASRVVRLAIVPPPNLRPGEYWAALEFEPLKGDITRMGDSTKVSLKFEVISTVLIPVIGKVGTPTYEGEFRDLHSTVESGKLDIDALVANTGTGRLRFKGTYEVRNGKGGLLAQGAAGEATVLPGAERRFVRTIQGSFDESTKYDVSVRYTSDALKEDLAGQTVSRWMVASDTTGIGSDTTRVHP
jgi:hypothetical protein